MNKTIIININGIVFHIEEDAYEILKNYMTDVKRHFMDSADSLEITTDIENRIAEMFTEILARDGKQVIVEQDVQAVVNQMGTIEDFASADEDGEPAIKPTPGYRSSGERRLFRNIDDHLLGGVCAGIANYFNIQPVWIRLAFLLTFAFFGTGLLVYIILWIVVPKAITRADRMAMKGEPLDLQGFKRNFEHELRNVGGTVNNLHQEARPVIYKTRDFFGDFFDHLGVFLRGAGKTLGKIIGISILLSCVALIIGLFVGLFAFFAYDNGGIMHVFPFNIINHEYNIPFMLGCFLVLALPLLGIVLLAIRLTFDRVAINGATGYSMLVIWLAAICVVVFFSVRVASEFKMSGRLSQSVAIKPMPDNTYYLELNQIKYLTAEDSAELDIKHNLGGRQIIDDDDNDFDIEHRQTQINLRIEKSDIPQPVLIEEFSARGRTKSDALHNAQSITYHFIQQDSILRFDRYPDLHNKKYRDQEVDLVLRVPLNTRLIIDDKLDPVLNGVNIYECRVNNKNENAPNATFVMTNTGLECKVDTLAIPADSLHHQK